MLYVLPVILTWLIPGRQSTLLLAGIALLLTWLGVVFSSSDLNREAVANRILSSTLLLVTAGLLLRQKRLADLAATAQRAHQESEERLRLFVEHAPAALAMFDRELRYLSASRRWVEDYRLGDRPIIGRHHYDVFSEIAGMERWKAVHQRCLAGAVETCEEELFTRADGSEDWLRWEVRPWRDTSGEIGGIIIFTENITQRKQVELALQESEKRLNLALAGAQMGLWDWNLSTDSLWWSERQFELFDVSKEEFKGTSAQPFEHIYVEDRSRVEIALMRARELGEEFREEFRVVHHDGTLRWLSGIGRPLCDEHRNCSRMIGINFDITDRKKIQEALTALNVTLEQRVAERAAELVQANERFEWMVKATHDGLYDWDLVRHTVYFSPRWREMHGFQKSESEESSQDWSERIHPDDRNRVLGALQDYLNGTKHEFWEEYRVRRNDGSMMWVLDRAVLLRDEQGRAHRMVGAETDITWRKEAEEAMRRGEHEFRMLADNVPALFGYLGLDRRYRFVNKRYEALFGLPAEQIVTMSVEELIGPEGYATVRPQLDKAFQGEACSFEYRLERQAGSPHWFSAQYVPDRDNQGKVTGLFILLADISQLKETEAALREREKQLSRLCKRLFHVKEEERKLIAREIHDDLTQRLAVLTLQLHRLAESKIAQDGLLSSQCEEIAKSAEELTTDLQKLAHHLHPAILEHVGLEAAVREQVEEFAAMAGLETEVIIGELPKGIPLDRATCLYRVLQESLRNVKKHADAATVLVRLVRTPRGIGLCVHDDGRGIADLEGAVRRKGLGLTSMEERLRLVNGTFKIRSKPGDGTEVHAWVPLDEERIDA